MKNTQSAQVKKAKKKSTVSSTAWRKNRFLDKFIAYCIVGKAAHAAGVSRRQVYNWVEKDSVFAHRFEDARKDVVEMLEAEAIRRACKGVNEPVFYKGKKCGLIKEYSDTLLIVLLKGNAPEKYKERNEITGKGGGPVSFTLKIDSQAGPYAL